MKRKPTNSCIKKETLTSRLRLYCYDLNNAIIPECPFLLHCYKVSHIGNKPQPRTFEGHEKVVCFSVGTNETYRNVQGGKVTDT